MSENEKYLAALSDALNHSRLSRRQLLKRSAILGLSVPVLSSLLAACGSDDSSGSSGDQPADEEEEITITWLGWWVNEWGDAHTRLIEGFEEAHPNIKVDAVFVPYPDMATRLTAASAGGDTQYDFFGTEGSWIPGLVNQGYIEPLDEWLANDPEFADRLVSTAPRVLQGTTYALNLYENVYHFAYNEDIFEEEGLEPPTSWEEFVEVMIALRDEGSNRYGMSMPLQDGGFILTRYFGFRLAQEGGRILDEDGNVVFNGPEGVRALEWWRDFYQQDLVVPGSMGEDQSLMLEFVINGQVAGIIDGPFILNKAREVDPDIRLAYAPAWRAETGGYLWAGSSLGMNAKSEKKEAVWKFFNYIYSDEVSTELTHAMSYPFSTKAAMASLADSDDPMLRMIPDMASQDPDHNLGFPVLTEGAAMVRAIQLAFQEVVTGEKDAQEALDEAAKVWQDAFDNYGN